MTDLLERLRDRGWRLTAQRRVIAEALSGPNLHLTADEVLAAARARLPEVGRATVYATLRELVSIGEVAEVSTDRGPVRYDPNAVVPHQHLVCDACSRVIDVPVEAPTLPERWTHGFTIDTVEVTFRGSCPSCNAAVGADDRPVPIV